MFRYECRKCKLWVVLRIPVTMKISQLNEKRFRGQVHAWPNDKKDDFTEWLFGFLYISFA